MRDQHVIPLGDSLAHEAIVECACLPYANPDDDGWVMVHNAWDGRKDDRQDGTKWAVVEGEDDE